MDSGKCKNETALYIRVQHPPTTRVNSEIDSYQYRVQRRKSRDGSIPKILNGGVTTPQCGTSQANACYLFRHLIQSMTFCFFKYFSSLLFCFLFFFSFKGQIRLLSTVWHTPRSFELHRRILFPRTNSFQCRHQRHAPLRLVGGLSDRYNIDCVASVIV